ncbi:hypothetical protein MMC18_008932 [Xylographa bjoerkii]|nr:hypothetical protein [Xylographa bjoerkii]
MMSNADAEKTNPIAQLSIAVILQASNGPATLDLSGNLPFDIHLRVRRNRTGQPRPLTFQTSNSVFDIPYAFDKGLLELIDLESGVRLESGELVNAASEPDEDTFTTLPHCNYERRRSLFDYDHSFPAGIADRFQGVLVSGHRYRLQLKTLDLGIKWWIYGTNEYVHTDDTAPDAVLLSEPALLVASRFTHQDFLVVESLQAPPPVSISLSLSSNTIRLSGESPATLRIVITNQSTQAVMVKSSADQLTVSPTGSSRTEGNHHRITSSCPVFIHNFVINRLPSTEDLVPTRQICTLGAGFGRRQFTDLMPGVPLVREYILPQSSAGFWQRTGEGEYRIKLRPCSVWWCFGTVKEVFGDKKALKRLPNGPTLPLELASEDEVVFRMV